MVLLLRYLKVKGVTVTDIAVETGVNYTSLYKVIARSTYTLKDGRVRVRSTPEVRAAVAAALCLPYEWLWGRASTYHLKKLILQEIERHAEEHQERLLKIYLPEAKKAA